MVQSKAGASARVPVQAWDGAKLNLIRELAGARHASGLVRQAANPPLTWPSGILFQERRMKGAQPNRDGGPAVSTTRFRHLSACRKNEAGLKAERRDGSRPFFCRRGFAGRFPTDRPAAACVWRASHLVVLKVSRSVDLNLICQRHQGTRGRHIACGRRGRSGRGWASARQAGLQRWAALAAAGPRARAPAGHSRCPGDRLVRSGSGLGQGHREQPGLCQPAAGGSIPMARIRARWVAACVLAQGKSGPDGKY